MGWQVLTRVPRSQSRAMDTRSPDLISVARFIARPGRERTLASPGLLRGACGKCLRRPLLVWPSSQPSEDGERFLEPLARRLPFPLTTVQTPLRIERAAFGVRIGDA